MANLLLIILLTFSPLVLFGTANDTPEAYIVYMGSPASNKGYGNSESVHLHILSSIIPSKEKEILSLIHSYQHAFFGFSAMLTEKEAALLSGYSGVVSVFRDKIHQLHTTRSWDFLDSETGIRSKSMYRRVSDDVIIGFIDTGIWPESSSFKDNGIGEVPARWKGVCMVGSDFKKSNCNRLMNLNKLRKIRIPPIYREPHITQTHCRKLIGARYYDTTHANPILRQHNSSENYKSDSNGSPRDSVGHGTHTASTAAGAMVWNSSYYGLARGMAKGGSPSSRIAMYKACTIGGCTSSNILKAIDDAIEDGVDIISISVGISSVFQSDFLNDPIAIGAFHADMKGVLVVCSAGNDGPDPYTVVNSAPWILTVGASSIDRSFQSKIVMGNNNVLNGSAINFSNLTSSRLYPLAFGGNLAGEFTPVYEASICYPGSLDAKKAAGKVVVCVDSDLTVPRRVKKLVAEDAGAKGLILIDQLEKGVPFDSGSFPFTEIGKSAGDQIMKYINSTKRPRACILPTVDVDGFKPAPVVAYFSSRGPGGLTESILKPDIMAPGVGILAATSPEIDTENVPPVGRKPSNFAIKSGTSMACPHVAGAAAFVRSVHPKWTSSMIRSALMTTATTSNNLGRPLTSSSAASASYHEMGAGEISPLRALNPGLVYETTTNDYLHFLCYYGYKDQTIRSVSGANFSCPKNSSEDFISNLNYPTISIGKLDANRSPKTISRTLTNVGHANATYASNVEPPAGILVTVSPHRLIFSEGTPRASFQVKFDGKGGKKGYNFGSLTWSDGKHSVRTVFAVNVT